jgi:CheY-like chemotaxis protein
MVPGHGLPTIPECGNSGETILQSTEEKARMIDLSQYKILVVDDEEDTRLFISTVLADQGAEVCQACDGVQALEAVRREMPDLMTLDISMPQKDGGEVFEEMRRDPELRDIPVIIISGRPELRRLIYQRTVPPPEGFIDKPVDERSLLLNVRKILSLLKR